MNGSKLPWPLTGGRLRNPPDSRNTLTEELP